MGAEVMSREAVVRDRYLPMSIAGELVSLSEISERRREGGDCDGRGKRRRL